MTIFNNSVWDTAVNKVGYNVNTYKPVFNKLLVTDVTQPTIDADAAWMSIFSLVRGRGTGTGVCY